MRLHRSLTMLAALGAAALGTAACATRDATPRDSSRAGATDSAASASAARVAAATSATPPATASPTAAIVVLYNFPKDTAAFEKYYRETHLPLLDRHAAELGFTRAVLVKFDRTADGKRPPYYRKAELWFPSREAMDRAMGTAGFKAVGGDFANFNTNGGPTVLIGHETNNQ